MIALLRRCRWLATLLLIASPAIGGQVLPLLHPCPVELPWVAAAEQGAAPAPVAADPHAHHGHGAPAEPVPAPAGHEHGADQCSCIGSCHTPAVLALPAIQIAFGAETTVPVGTDWPVIEATGIATRAVDLLPPKTAPPLV